MQVNVILIGANETESMISNFGVINDKCTIEHFTQLLNGQLLVLKQHDGRHRKSSNQIQQQISHWDLVDSKSKRVLNINKQSVSIKLKKHF